MAASLPANTKSTCTAQVVRGEHRFEIEGYGHKRNLGIGKFVRSDTFAAGGHRWCIRCYPGGFDAAHRAFVSVFVKLMTVKAKARALFDLRLVDPATGAAHSVYRLAEPVVFDYSVERKKCKGFRGTRAFMTRSDLEASSYLVHGESLTIECIIDVVAEPQVPRSKAFPVDVPPSGLPEHLGNMLEEKNGVDVTFVVQGEDFHAHKVLLAARSPVFMAELYGPTQDDEITRVAIDDIQPTVFRALLHFIYREKLVIPDDLEEQEYKETIRRLREAADRYGMERLKMICELILCKSLDGNTAAVMIASADRCALNDVCVQFMSVDCSLEG